MESIDEIEGRARKVISIIDRLVPNAMEDILHAHREFCGSEAGQVLMAARELITDEVKLRLHFECLCFATFFAVLSSEKYVPRKMWFLKGVQYRASELFRGALAVSLVDHCRCVGMLGLPEITVAALEPEVRFARGAPVDPIDRLNEYWRCHEDAPGDELKIFGMRIGVILEDSRHYLVLSTAGRSFGIVFARIANVAMKTAFGQGTGRSWPMAAVGRILLGVVGLSLAAIQVMRHLELEQWQLSVGLLVLGIDLHIVNVILIQVYTRKHAPELASRDEVAPGTEAWELTAGLGVVPRWVSWLGLLAISAFITAALPWLIWALN